PLLHLQQMQNQPLFGLNYVQRSKLSPVRSCIPREEVMDFGYFTLSDHHYENNARSSNQFVADIAAEALLADKLGMHSAWIGEHHFNSLGVLSCPDLVLAYIAAQTKRIRLAPGGAVAALH